MARLVPKSKEGRKFFFCFVDFETSEQASVAQQSLNGYRFHPKDQKGLAISFAAPTHSGKQRCERRSRSESLES